MRLSQLARQISKSSRELIVFLESRGINNYQSSNSKIEPDHVRMVLDHFTPYPISSPDQVVTDIQKNKEEDSESPSIKRKKTPEPTTLQTESQEPEVIRAPKMKLQGVKVVGKIELPAKTEKPEKTSENKEPGEKSGKLPGSKKDIKGTIYTQSSQKKNPARKLRANRRLSYLEKQKREEQKREKEKRERLRKEKERKRVHYQKKVQSKIQPDPSKQKYPSKKSRNLERDHPEPTPVHNNPLRRFWAWLNGAYDEEI